MISSGVTQTGQPGPWTSSSCGGNSSSMPYRMSVWVCPPQISMSTQGRVTVAAISVTRERASLGSRYSSMNFMRGILLRGWYQEKKIWGKPGTDRTGREFPAKGARNPWQSCQSPGRLVVGVEERSQFGEKWFGVKGVETGDQVLADLVRRAGRERIRPGVV